MSWRDSRVAADGSHHVLGDAALYDERFDAVLKFHAPGLAAVQRGAAAWHIHLDGSPAYNRRFERTFGFYQALAAVQHQDGWHHIHTDGRDLNAGRYDWCGNFQCDRCTVRQLNGKYFHVMINGEPAYHERWKYAGDFRDGIGVVQAEDGLSTHIDLGGQLLHGRWFNDLDVFHKGFARARDEGGWMHIDSTGRPIYTRRFAGAEPFYNGQARVELPNGGLELIDEAGCTLHRLRAPLQTAAQRLSGLMVGFWKTQAVRVAAELRLFNYLPATSEQVAEKTSLPLDGAHRLLRGLWELDLVQFLDAQWVVTETGALLCDESPSAMTQVVSHWGIEHYAAWTRLKEALATGEAAFDKMYGQSFFTYLTKQPGRLENYHRAMQGYAKHDYACLINYIRSAEGAHIIDAGGGTGTLIAILLAHRPDLTGILLDRPEVVDLPTVETEAGARLQRIGADLFSPWSCCGDLMVLARVLHDWNDTKVQTILRHARQALNPNGCIVLIEMTLCDDASADSLLNLNMLTICGGRERTVAAWSALAEATGLRLRDVQRLPTYGSLLTLDLAAEHQ